MNKGAGGWRDVPGGVITLRGGRDAVPAAKAGPARVPAQARDP